MHSISSMPKVAIYQLGYPTVNVPRVCALLNRCQKYFEFREGTSILNIGKPDISNCYSDKVFVKLLGPYLDEHDYSVAVTVEPIEDNHFTRTVGQRLIITTSFQSEELIQRAGRTMEENLILTICQELASLEFQRVTGKSYTDLFHDDTRGCIFDFVAVKTQKFAKLLNCDICKPCRGKLAETNINTNVLDSVDRVLRRIRRPSFKKALSASVTGPGLAFLYGGIVVGALVR